MNEHPAKIAMEAFARLTTHVEEYESDTFSASAVTLTHAEASAIAAKLIAQTVDGMIDGDLDGLGITDVFDDVRPDEDPE